MSRAPHSTPKIVARTPLLRTPLLRTLPLPSAVWCLVYSVLFAGTAAAQEAAVDRGLKAAAAEKPPPDPQRAETKRLLWKGRYAEALETAETWDDQNPDKAWIKARCLEETGRRDEAWTVVRAAAEKFDKDARFPAEAARLAFVRGDVEAAEKMVAEARKRDPHNISANWTAAQLLRDAGKLAEAEKACGELVKKYNEREQKGPAWADADELRWVGAAAAEHARWTGASGQFGFLVNELSQQQLELTPEYWPAHLEAGRLFGEKYNDADAAKEFQAGLKINPNAAELYVELGFLAVQKFEIDKAQALCDLALKRNPEIAAGHRLQADLHLANFKVDDALEVLEKKALPLNPRSEETLGRLAACYVVLDGLSPKDAEGQTRFGAVAKQVDGRNPHCGVFYFSMAQALDGRRRFSDAVRFYQEAMRRMPKLVGPQGSLGMLHMRLGEEEVGAKLLEKSFEADPFNVRVGNMLKVVEVLEGYQIMRTEHFIIKYNEQHDKLLAKYAARYLEQQYPELCKQFGYEVPQPSLFEIFSQARNTDGHGWFSARLIGLPYLGTVGACAGKMVGIASPNERPYHWARVLKHEFIHVINLQQTNYNLPHWLAEGIATYNEGYPRPESWNDLLIERSKKKELFTLQNVNLGFIRPKTGLDWQMAYCQSELYVEFLFATYGQDSVAKLLAAYADNLDTPAVLERCFQTTPEAFDAAFLQYVDKVVAGLSARRAPPEQKLADLERAQQASPDDPDLCAALANALLARKDYAGARKLAKHAMAKKEHHPLSGYVLARTDLVIGEQESAEKQLQACLDPKAPQENVLALLASLKLKAGDHAGASALYDLGLKADPENVRWVKGAAQVAVLTQNAEKAAQMLERLALLDADNFTIRKKLAQLALQGKRHESAVHWGMEALYVNVMDPDIHGWLAEAHWELNQLPQAQDEWLTAAALKSADGDSAVGELGLRIAQALVDAEKPGEARAMLAPLKLLVGDDPRCKTLEERLSP